MNQCYLFNLNQNLEEFELAIFTKFSTFFFQHSNFFFAQNEFSPISQINSNSNSKPTFSNEYELEKKIKAFVVDDDDDFR